MQHPNLNPDVPDTTCSPLFVFGSFIIVIMFMTGAPYVTMFQQQIASFRDFAHSDAAVSCRLSQPDDNDDGYDYEAAILFQIPFSLMLVLCL